MHYPFTHRACATLLFASFMLAGAASAMDKGAAWPAEPFRVPDTLKIPLAAEAEPAVQESEEPFYQPDTDDQKPAFLRERKAERGTFTPFLNGSLSRDLPDSGWGVGHLNPTLDPNARSNLSLEDVDGSGVDRRFPGSIRTGVQYHF